MDKATEKGGGDEGGRKRKLTQGRKKIPMKLIEDRNKLDICFSKRRKGLVKKAFELSMLCGAQVCLVVFSPAGNVYTYGHSSLDAVLDRLRGRSSASRPVPDAEEAAAKATRQTKLRKLLRQEEELIKARDAERCMGKKLEAEMRSAGVRIDGDVRSWDLPELQATLGALKRIQAEGAVRTHEIFAQEAMMQQCTVGGAGGNLLGYLGSGPSYTPGHEEAAMYTTMNLMGGGAGNNLFDYLGSGSFAADRTDGHDGHSVTLDTTMRLPGNLFHDHGSVPFVTHGIDEVTIDTMMNLMGGNVNHALRLMMPPPPPLALPLNHGYGYNDLGVAGYGYHQEGDLGDGYGHGAFYEYGTTWNFFP